MSIAKRDTPSRTRKAYATAHYTEGPLRVRLFSTYVTFHWFHSLKPPGGTSELVLSLSHSVEDVRHMGSDLPCESFCIE